MNFSSTSEETRGLVGFIIFVIFLIFLFVAGLIGLVFIGDFFNKVDKLKHSDFSIDVQNAFRIKNQQMFEILKIRESNRTKIQNDTLEIDKIFIETKLNERLKSKINDHFDKIDNLRLIPLIDEPDLLDVSFTIKTTVMPRNNIKTYQDNVEKILNTPQIYKDLDIDKNIIILSESTKPIVFDAVDSDKFISFKTSKSNSLKSAKSEIATDTMQKDVHNREIDPNQISYNAYPILTKDSSYESDYLVQEAPYNQFTTELLNQYTQKLYASSEYNNEDIDNLELAGDVKSLSGGNNKEISSTSSTTTSTKKKRKKKSKKTTPTTTVEITPLTQVIKSTAETVNEIKSSSKSEIHSVKAGDATKITKLEKNLANSTKTSLITKKFKSLDEFLMKLVDESTIKKIVKNKI